MNLEYYGSQIWDLLNTEHKTAMQTQGWSNPQETFESFTFKKKKNWSYGEKKKQEIKIVIVDLKILMLYLQP